MKQVIMYNVDEIRLISAYLTNCENALKRLRASNSRNSALYWLDEARRKLVPPVDEQEDYNE